jgi:iron complex transport system substrate-binding protein
MNVQTAHVRLIAAGLASLGLLLSGCSAREAPGDNSTAGGPTTSSIAAQGQAGSTHYPVTVTDCDGRETTYDSAPQRIVTLDDNITETLISLGLADRIVGITKFDTPDGEWETTREVMDSLPVLNASDTLSSGYPSQEVVLAAAPDIVLSVYDSAFSKAYGPVTHDGLTQMGINSYQTLQDCGMYRDPQGDFDLLYDDIRNLGIIFDVQADAEALVNSLKGRVSDLQSKGQSAGLGSYRIGMHDGETEHPGTLGVTTANAIITLAGSTYAFVEDDRGNTAMSWETFIARDPEVIWVITDLGQTADQVEHQLETDPRTQHVDAVANKRYVVVSYNDAIGSPRCVDGLADMIDGLIALKSQHLL